KIYVGRRFFVTKKGYFGLGPKGATNGDQIAVILGIDVPFILRKRLSQLWMIGETCARAYGWGAIKQWEVWK
ncbi:hypothetical protein K469DRAFT_588448, partial [Zopfia rhizophila CBS 207.26]